MKTETKTKTTIEKTILVELSLHEAELIKLKLGCQTEGQTRKLLSTNLDSFTKEDEKFVYDGAFNILSDAIIKAHRIDFDKH